MLILNEPTRGIECVAKYEIYWPQNQLAQEWARACCLFSDLSEIPMYGPIYACDERGDHLCGDGWKKTPPRNLMRIVEHALRRKGYNGDIKIMLKNAPAERNAGRRPGIAVFQVETKGVILRPTNIANLVMRQNAC